MKKILLIIALITVVGALFYGCIKIEPEIMAPADYESTVLTGGDIESNYLAHGTYEVAYMEEETDAPIRKYQVYYPKEIENSNKKYPVIVFVNGSGVRASRYKAMFEHMASWGFIVIGNEEDTAYSGENANKCLDYLLALGENSDSIFYNRVDESNIGITGHSQGGVGVFNAVTNTDRYKAMVSLSPVPEASADVINWDYDPTKIEIPIMIFAGTDKYETISLEQLEVLYSHISSEKIMARRKNTTHSEMLYSGDGYVTAWFMWHLQGDEEAGKAFYGENAEILNNEKWQDVKVNP